MGGADKVVNSIAVRGRDQVMLKVTVAEVARSIIKQLGIDLTGTLNYGTAVVNFNNANPFTAFGRSLVGGNNVQRLRSAARLPSKPPFARWKARAWCAPWPNLI